MSNKRVRAEIKMNGETVAKVGHPEGLSEEQRMKIMFDVFFRSCYQFWLVT
ncbi:TPA: hypothetical protein U2B98_002141 [Streptococcus suis]|uniref:hypothetical protein n=1 Tax=Streptococcus suis TaxID=1307 RepID=UPI0013750CBA|nr:hypothetical protein [Streptococcus suis]HEM2809630.1 hypothetical protein [Streptococcus suis]HEM6089402.1 hypothetical protein [Streptococcus suis]HEM6113154.1 hypothetical protein [Streptococcus suis]HEM6266495.1 hypothetical protein [Streptococcus suis]HEM6290320.1 hypothetical protein [Streptococcus suis]